MSSVEKITLYPIHAVGQPFLDDEPFDDALLPAEVLTRTRLLRRREIIEIVDKNGLPMTDVEILHVLNPRHSRLPKRFDLRQVGEWIHAALSSGEIIGYQRSLHHPETGSQVLKPCDFTH